MLGKVGHLVIQTLLDARIPVGPEDVVLGNPGELQVLAGIPVPRALTGHQAESTWSLTAKQKQVGQTLVQVPQARHLSLRSAHTGLSTFWCMNSPRLSVSMCRKNFSWEARRALPLAIRSASAAGASPAARALPASLPTQTTYLSPISVRDRPKSCIHARPGVEGGAEATLTGLGTVQADDHRALAAGLVIRVGVRPRNTLSRLSMPLTSQACTQQELLARRGRLAGLGRRTTEGDQSLLRWRQVFLMRRQDGGVIVKA